MSRRVQGGEAESMLLLGRMLQKGYGCVPDDKEAERWLARYHEASGEPA